MGKHNKHYSAAYMLEVVINKVSIIRRTKCYDFDMLYVLLINCHFLSY